jgi:ADP-ribose pyrophosphatase
MSKIKLKETRKLTNERWINLYETLFDKPNGQPGRWVFTSRNRNADGTPTHKSDAVIIVGRVVENAHGPVKVDQQRLCMIKEYRIPIQDYEYHFPAGLLEAGESLETAARRELKEEAGLELLKITDISPNLYSSTGLTDESATMVFCDCKDNGEKQHLDSTEEIELMLLTHPEVMKVMKDSSKRMSAKTWPVLLMYERLGQF